MNTTIILGPPGTGKTTRLLDIIEKEIANGLSPDRIAFCSFTKKATEEAIDRVVERFKFKRTDMRYFKTVHSLAFHTLGLSRSQVMQKRDYQKIGDHLGLTFSTKDFDFEGFAPVTKNTGDQYIFIHGFARARQITPRQVWDTIDPIGLNWFEFLRYCDTVDAYKRDNGLVDFADMLLCETELPVDVLIVDEAQDLSTAQWQFLYPTMRKAKRVYVGGDDDQAIFAWGGADVQTFLALQGRTEILTQSHRLPKAVYNLAGNIASKIRHRKHKEFMPKNIAGDVVYWNAVDYIDFTSGTWLLLARNSYLLGEFIKVVREKGVPYSIKGKASIAAGHVDAIKTYEQWRASGEIEPSAKENVSLFIPENATWDRDKIWHRAFTCMDAADREYYVSLLRRGESLSRRPRINISTIHGSKGGEADNVVMLTDMAMSTWNASTMDEDSEHRVWYVGATRAKNNLHIVAPRGRYGYQV